MTAPVTEDWSTETTPASSNGTSNASSNDTAKRASELSKSSQFRATLLADRNRHRRRRTVAAIVLLVVVAGVVGAVVVARSANASPATQYRTATASVHDVEQQLTNVATIEPVTQAAVAFPTSGTVASVDVNAGATVTAGQPLAALDATQLQVSLHNAQSSLANAQLSLENTLNTAASQATSTTTTQRTTTTTAATDSSAQSSSANASSVPTSSVPTVSGSNASTPQASSGQASATQASATQAAAAQASGSGSSTGSPSSGGAGKTVSSADELAAQQAVTAAQAAVTAAEQAIAQATIVSPIKGTVEAVNIKVGDSVSSGSTTATIVIVGDGGVEAATTVNVDNVSKVKVGQAALVRPDGTAQPLNGHVVTVSAMPINSSGTTTYRVTIGLQGDTSSLRNGSTATASIITDTTKATLAVPTSAISTNGDRHTVTVFDGTSTKQVDVQIGAIGQTWTAVTSGLTDGQAVVLADINTPMPNASTNSTTQTNRNGANGFPGGGVPGGGFPGGGGGFPGGGAGGGAPRGG